MEEIYRLQSMADYGDTGFQSTAEYEDRAALMTPENLILPLDYRSLLVSSGAFREHNHHHHQREAMFGSNDSVLYSAASEAVSTTIVQREVDVFGAIKARIASHPTYPRLIHAYIECQKVGASPEIAGFLDEIRRKNDLYKKQGDYSCNSSSMFSSTCLGADPELDEFMETYCDMLVKYKSDLSRTFDEATTFLSKIETQLTNLCTSSSSARVSSSVRILSDEGGGMSSDEDFSGGEMDVQEAQQRGEDRDLKDRLMRRFGSHLGTLKLEFSKKKKKGKLPKEARQTLLDWWSVHYKWPYPTEADKIALAESTGLDQRQINNWFINQRKRHWRPSENMQRSPVRSSTERQALFNRIAPVYDNLNDLLSLGQHRIWKRMAVSWSGAKMGETVLDLCCGSGDLAFLLSEKVGSNGKVIGLDFSKEQLSVASSRQKLKSKACYLNIEWVEGDATELPFSDGHLDAITMAYGLRNVVDKHKAMKEIFRVLKAGSRVSILDFNKSTNPIVSSVQDLMIDNVVVPVASGFGLEEDYKYLKISITEFLTGDELEKLALDVGFSNARYYEIGGSLMGNLVATR
ncbi:hypothetical protein ACFX1Q_022109 [Malus domestica]